MPPQTPFDMLDTAVSRFLLDIEHLPPWKEAGRLFGQKVQALHQRWLDAREQVVKDTAVYMATKEPTELFTFTQHAKRIWEKIHPRIQHMSDVKEGTQAEYCINDIAEALRATWDEACDGTVTQENFWKAHVPVTIEMHEPSKGFIHGYCERCRELWPCKYSPERTSEGK